VETDLVRPPGADVPPAFAAALAATFARAGGVTLSTRDAAIENANVLTPFALCTDTLPRCISAIAFTIARPRP